MPRKKAAKQAAPRYRVDRTKPLSNARRFEYLWSTGVMIDGHLLKGKQLAEYIDDRVWRDAHPGEDPVCVF